ncbi:hypothetical protein [Chitinivorax sp. B]|uniref:hypothetical protein n=1 Tax=Chitinivorax sp. B TaxID=2502235 RepID=UPI0010FA1D4C|nr:hypothetical protein [Chitinivorax sp. B]
MPAMKADDIYCKVLRELANLLEDSLLVQTEAWFMDGIRFQCNLDQQDGIRPKVLLYCDFGVLPDRATQAAYAFFLTSNVFLFGEGEGAYCLIPGTTRIVLCLSIELHDFSVAGLFIRSRQMAEMSSLWRAEQPTTKSTDMSGSSLSCQVHLM